MVEARELKLNLKDYLQRQGHSLRRPFRCLNPAHEDRHPSMSYNPRAENVHCFSCGATYDLLDLVGLDYGLGSYREKYDKACELFAYPEAPRVEIGSVERESSRAGEWESLRAADDGERAYFRGRGVTLESCAKYGLFQAGGYAYFPIMEGGTCIGWCARAVEENSGVRYLNSKGPMGIWNGDVLQEGDSGSLFVTEGIIDALCLIQMGEKAVALCGSQNARKLLRRCEENPTEMGRFRFVACGDPDEAGRRMNADLKAGLEGLGISCGELVLEASDGDVGALYRRDPERLASLVRAASAGTALRPVSEGLEDFLDGMENRRESGRIPTGFRALDRCLNGGLHPGLYVIGAVSSLGKTSFLLQIADFVAAGGRDALFFSLEQSEHELMAKSISRVSAELDGVDGKIAFTTSQLLYGQQLNLFQKKLLERTKEAYSPSAQRLYIREGMADVGAEEIRAAVDEHRKQSGRTPVVIVDYLQILRPQNAHSTDKQNTDRSVVALKRLSRDFGTPVVAISSFNRESYRYAVTMEAFKESGAVEYSSDVLMGLQLKGTGRKDFDVNAEKLRDPRKIELVILKNRNGIPYAKVQLDYYAKYNLFAEVGNRMADYAK